MQIINGSIGAATTATTKILITQELETPRVDNLNTLLGLVMKKYQSNLFFQNKYKTSQGNTLACLTEIIATVNSNFCLRPKG